jgi:hypothetical protein
MTTILIILAFTFLEWARGRDVISKGVFYPAVLLILYLMGGEYFMLLGLPIFMTGWVHNSKALRMIMDGKDNRDEEGAPIRTWFTDMITHEKGVITVGYYPHPITQQQAKRWGLIYSFLTYFYLPFIPLCYWYASRITIMSYDLPDWVADTLSRVSMIDHQMRVERLGIAEALKGLGIAASVLIVRGVV